MGANQILDPAFRREIFAAVKLARTAWDLDEPAFVRLLAESYEAARRNFEDVELSESDFCRHIAEKLLLAPDGDSLSASLTGLHLTDLYLACACLNGSEAAIRHFERLHLSEIRGILSRMDGLAGLVDDVRHIVRARLLVGEDDGPKLRDYAGRGSLGSWVRAAAVRTALTLRRKQKREVPLEAADTLASLASTADAELSFLKGRYEHEFKRAFEDSLAALSSKQRNLLRLHVLDGLSLDEVGLIYRVHRATVARWIARAREDLFEGTRRLLVSRLHLTSSEFQSLMQLLRSQLDVSLHRFLSTEEVPGHELE